MGDVKMNFVDNKFKAEVDTDQDNVNSIALEINLPEAYEEAFKRGDVIEGTKYVTVKMEGTKLSIDIDSDRDGEKVASIVIDAFEAFDEGSKLVSDDDKKEEE